MMNRLDRALGILLLLRSRKDISAGALAQRFEVSTRTIYRDVETLSALGVPVYAQRGRGGGFRLLEGYFLPPVTFTQGEALALVVGLALLGSLRSKPFASDLDTAWEKLVAAVPEKVRATLLQLQRHIGFEVLQEDIFHPEGSNHEPASEPATGSEPAMAENEVISTFVHGIVSRSSFLLRYRSPFRRETETHSVVPLGAFWDRGYWYLVGSAANKEAAPRLWRGDRVLGIYPQATSVEAPLMVPAGFDVRDYLDRRWLAAAMRTWAEEAPVRIRLTQRQATRLRRDWYYRRAQFEPLTDGEVVMTFGEEHQETALELVRWLGPGAELLEPEPWRAALEAQLAQMLACYH